ncbi:Glucose-6-phosphate 1-dehydrogenase [Acholeplasma oculi]|uniref:Glucose-6-phosphate 1-dehydrogenase n=1 Tax=Acholeplasma oculi TaxID=35623 RepID=A0A061A9P2_9MOLU|nr:glucose-6-phosphate dehydrogenase [Acholeplasma oculi]CDR30588.1 Glucose-6-phosphate 1-dehydrogenase [Acholeplasma oculi]SKC46575.1 glucose-6-phosphate 1-dehydrogenase [Acholeplasma oculi]SUT89290.1 Glucose-6-phosphate 1-dehydrogenase [Acholeplasma oculi]
MKNDLIVTIFGSTGDLTARKLLPALAKLYKQKTITQNVKVICLGRRDYDTETYLNEMQKLTSKSLDLPHLSKFVEYFKMQITDLTDYQKLNTYIRSISNEHSKHIYYLAIGPEILADVAKNISESKLIEFNNTNQVLVFEKPFGHNLESAVKVNQMLWNYFDEKQIYRIDHYLGKEMIQNLMTLRFANRIFEDTWDSKSIESVKIFVKEEEGILNRAGYYDTSGALKDMVQSHLLQILSLVAMDPPNLYESDYIKDEKVKVIRSLNIDKKSVLFGQYKGYLEELNIPKDSKTETFVYFRVFVNTPRFRGVPFEILTGKKLSQKESYVEISYHKTSEQEKWNLPLHSNKLRILINPKGAVDLSINSKMPGLKDNLEVVHLNFTTTPSVEGNIPEAYEKLLLDIVEGSRTLFTRWDEIEASWHFIDEIKKCPHSLFVYESEHELMEKIN